MNGDPLAWWNDGATKSALLEFIDAACDVAVHQRVAVFDHDDAERE